MKAVVQNSLNEQLCSTFCIGGKENKTIIEILVAEAESETDAEASDLKDEFSEFEEEQKASAQQDEPRATTSSESSLKWGPPQGRNLKSTRWVIQQKA